MIKSAWQRPPHELFFWSASFFLIGVFISSFLNLLGSLLATVLILVLLTFLRQKKFVPFVLATLIGSSYYIVFDLQQRPVELRAEGIVTSVKQKINSQELILENKVKIITTRHPQYNYGDQIIAAGKIKESKNQFINGLVSYPKIKLVASNKGSPIKAWLVNLRLSFEDNIKKVLPHNKAVFLSGLTTGNIAEISDEFNEQLKASGTSHLVALSGYNINIILDYLGWLGFWPSILIVIAFVIMTGAEASLIRAAIMGIIVLVAEKSKRVYSVRNAIIFAALVMILVNPKTLIFDTGFQLSFLALLGIVYIKPLLEKRLPRISKNILLTIAAQIAVLPLIILKFGRFNLFSPLANILINPFVPATMFLGFAAGTTGFISQNLSLLIAWFANIFLSYEILVINFFALYF